MKKILAIALLLSATINASAQQVTSSPMTNASNLSSGTIPNARISALPIPNLQYNPIIAPSGFNSGPYYTTITTSATTASAAANTLYAVPFYSAVAKTFTKISYFEQGAGTATECELGLYADNGSGAPGALITDAGQVAPSGQSEITGLSLAIVPGVQWLAVGCNGTVTLEAATGPALGQVLGWSTDSAAYNRYQVAWTFSTGNLPTPFSGALNTGSGPFVYLRF